jgi:hypothetical protein
MDQVIWVKTVLPKYQLSNQLTQVEGFCGEIKYLQCLAGNRLQFLCEWHHADGTTS